MTWQLVMGIRKLNIFSRLVKYEQIRRKGPVGGMEGARAVAGGVQERWLPSLSVFLFGFYISPSQSVWGLKYAVTQELSVQGV